MLLTYSSLILLTFNSAFTSNLAFCFTSTTFAFLTNNQKARLNISTFAFYLGVDFNSGYAPFSGLLQILTF
jgi:hypothetical protein